MFLSAVELFHTFFLLIIAACAISKGVRCDDNKFEVYAKMMRELVRRINWINDEGRRERNLH